MSDVAVSIIIPVYNSARFLRECLDSVLSQSFQDYEVLCVDDGSTDDSASILEEYAGLDCRLCVIRQEHSNAGDARNRGITQARGEYLLFLDADDVFNPLLCGELYKEITAAGADVCVCGADMFRSKDGKTIPWTPLDLRGLPASPFSPWEAGEQLFLFSGAITWNKMYRRETVLRLNLRFQSQIRANDLYFVYCMLALSKKIAVVDLPLIHYRVGTAGSLQSNNDRAPGCFLNALYRVFDEFEVRGIRQRFEKGLEKAAIHQIVYNLDSLKSDRSFEQLYQQLQDEGVPRLGLDLADVQSYRDWGTRLRLRWIREPGKKWALRSRIFRRLGLAFCMLWDKGAAAAFQKVIQKVFGR